MAGTRQSRAWTVLASCLITVGALLAPAAVIASWADVELTSTDRFVDTLAPLAEDAAVQKFVSAQTSRIVEEQLDLDGIAASGIGSLGVGPLAEAALTAVTGSAVDGLRSVIDSGISDFVASDAFAGVWRQTLRASHSEVLAALEGDDQAALAFGADGSIGVQLGPVVAAVRQSLIDQGLPFASLIPEVDRTVVVAQSDSLPAIQAGYQTVVAVGPWLPWLALGLLVAGVLVARRRAVALIGAGVSLSLAMILTLIGLALARSSVVSQLGADSLPADVVGSIVDHLTGDMRATALTVLVLAVLAAAAGWAMGPFERSHDVRRWASSQIGRMRRTTPVA